MRVIECEIIVHFLGKRAVICSFVLSERIIRVSLLSKWVSLESDLIVIFDKHFRKSEVLLNRSADVHGIEDQGRNIIRNNLRFKVFGRV